MQTRLCTDRWNTGKSVWSAGASLLGFATDARQTNKIRKQLKKLFKLGSPGLTFFIQKSRKSSLPPSQGRMNWSLDQGT